MTKKLIVWGREFYLEVIYDVYEGEQLLDIQKEAIVAFEAASDDILKSYKQLEEYCIKRDGDLIEVPIKNIFKYVMPQALYVKRNEKKRVVSLLCNYRFDEEHGIALTFENEKLKGIGTQDDI